jgi:hypothetical protein
MTEINEKKTSTENERQCVIDCEKELERAYRCIRGFWTATKKGEPLDGTALTYHSPTIAAACRFVADGKLDGAEYFIGKHVSVMHEALDQSPPSEVERLRRDCAELYQVIGVLSASHADLFEHPQVTKALDNASAASNGDPRPHDDLLPFNPPVTRAGT